MEKLEAALIALGEAANDYLKKESFGRAEAGLVTAAEQMLQMRAAWGKQIECAKPQAASAVVYSNETAAAMPGRPSN